jgi:predicted alpha/beta-fold hydrolase
MDQFFRPASGLGHPHVQTIFPRYHRRKPLVIDRSRERYALPDGDELLLDHHIPSAIPPEAMHVLIVHGLSGSSSSHYVLGLQIVLSQMGWPSTAMNSRGAVEPNRKVRAYHAGHGDDIDDLVRKSFAREGRPIAIVGYSIGGSMTLHAMQKLSGFPGLAAAVVVSVPWDFPQCANRMRRGFSRIYTRVILGELIEQFQAKANFLRSLGNDDGAALIESKLALGPFSDFWEFDDRVVAPLHGFKDVHDYYAQSSPKRLLKTVNVPMLAIHAADDPFMTPDVIPGATDLSPHVTLEASPKGGHVGFIAGSIRKPVYYLEQRIPAYLREIQRRRTRD